VQHLRGGEARFWLSRAWVATLASMLVSMFALGALVVAVSPYEPSSTDPVTTSASNIDALHAVYEVAPNALTTAPLSYEVIPSTPGAEIEPQVFPDEYAAVDGVLTFRGGPMRNGGAWGTAKVVERKLKIVWRAQTAEGKEPWGGGAGWTGQPAIIRWPKDVVPAMKVRVPDKSAHDFVEVVQGSLDGKVYFLDLWTGKPTRAPIDTGNLIKGSVSIDPRGVPLLFVGQGLAWKKPIALRMFSLVNNKELFVLRGLDEQAPIQWGAFDSSGVLNRLTDTFVVGGENGLLYAIKLNTEFVRDPDAPGGPSLTIAPEILRYKSVYEKARRSGIENSVSVVKNLAYFAMDDGIIQAMDLRTYQPLWTFATGDDTDASLTLSIEDGQPMLYTGNEVDKRGVLAGKSFLRKIDGLTGEELWSRWLPCEGAAEPKRKEPGLFSTNVVGSGDVDDLVVFMVSRCPKVTGGTLVALDKATGKDVWRRLMKAPGWSSTTAFKDQDGKTWLLQGDMHGKLHLIDARTGQLVHFVQLEGNIEASPAVFDNRIVVGTRSQTIYGIEIR
jgi:outer membrane protein assembly factor BamB